MSPSHANLILRRPRASAAVSKDGQHTRCGIPPVETRRCATLLRVMLWCYS